MANLGYTVFLLFPQLQRISLRDDNSRDVFKDIASLRTLAQ